MGIVSSAILKPEHKSQNNQVTSGTSEKVGDPKSGWRYRFDVFMKRGPCKQVFEDFQDCTDEAENKGESIRKCLPMLEKCLEANSHYYQPVMEVQKNAEESMMTAFLTSTFSLDKEKAIENVSLNHEEEAEKQFIAFMKGGDCKDSFMAWYDCMSYGYEEAEGNHERFVTKCAGLSATWAKCMDVHSDYYHPVLKMMKTTEDQWEKELQVMFSEKS